MSFPVFTAETPNHYTVSARKIREAGFKCAFRNGSVYVWRKGECEAQSMSIDQGRWMNSGDLNSAPWATVNLAEECVRARAIERDCYCGTCGIAACDFCQGVREPDGSFSTDVNSMIARHGCRCWGCRPSPHVITVPFFEAFAWCGAVTALGWGASMFWQALS